MIHARIRPKSGEILHDPSPEQLHKLLEDTANLSWIDLESPTPDELGLIAGILGWDHLTVEDLTNQGQRAKLEQFPTYHYLVMHALEYGAPPEGGQPRLTTPEIDFVIGPSYVVSVHYVHLAHLTENREVVERLEQLMSKGPDYILYVLTDRLVDSYFPVLDEMQDAVDDLEDSIIENVRGELLPRIFDMKHDAMVLRKVTSPLLDVFSRLTAPGMGIVSEEHAFYFRDVHDHIIRVFESTDSYRELMSGALDAYLSTTNNRMNDVMKRLTVVAALFLPITFLTGLLGMNLRESPPWDDYFFWVFLGGMFGLSVAQYLYMRRKGWT
jgi:magnesium transporter